MRKVSESGFETGLGPAMRGQTGLETAPDNRTVTRFTYAPEQKVRVLSQTLHSFLLHQALLGAIYNPHYFLLTLLSRSFRIAT